MAAAILITAAAVGSVLGRGATTPDQPRAAGLRGSRLPAQLTRGHAPHIRLHGADGELIDTRALSGRPYAVTFLYTRCPDVCPLIGQELASALKQLGRRAAGVTVLGVSVDPTGDTPRAARRWLVRERLPANFHYLVGTTEALRPVWRSYFAAPQLAGRPETSSHTASVWLIDKRGHRRTRYSGGAPIDAADLAHDLRRLLDESPRQGATP